MGLDIYSLKLLLEAHRRHGPFGRTLQVGRQGDWVWEGHRDLANAMVAEYGVAEDFAGLVESGHYIDVGLLPALGATEALALDASAYEGAAIVADMNAPVPTSLHQRFDTIVEFGSLEHIFNVPMALSNMMNMLKVGGRLLSCTPANNTFGHGFYQFGPELPFRVFTAANGFRRPDVFVVKLDGSPRLEPLEDAGARGERYEPGGTDGHAAHLMSIAVKQAHVTPFGRWPQQGDYQAIWDDAETGPAVSPSRNSVIHRLRQRARRVLASTTT